MINPSLLDIAYLAGIMDGEGSFVLQLKKGRRDVDFRMSMSSTSADLLIWVAERFGGHNYWNVHKASYIAGHKQSHNWVIAGKKAVALCQMVEPFLVIKGAQAKVFQEAWVNHGTIPIKDRRRVKPTEETFTRREEYVSQMRELNKRGWAV